MALTPFNFCVRNRKEGMAFQRVFRIALCISITLCASCVIPMNVVAEDAEYYSVWELEYPTKYKLVWYYKTERDFKNNQPNVVRVGDKEFQILPYVRPPMINGIYLMEYFQVNEGEEVLDIGTGSGVHAIFAVEKAKRVVATDIYPPAIENAKINAQLHSVEQKIDFRVGDLLEPLGDNETFDVFFFNINLPFSVTGKDRRMLHERFFSEVRKHMKPNARIYYQTSFVENIPYIHDMLSRNDFRIMEMHMKYFPKQKHEAVFLMVQSAEQQDM